MQKTNSLFMLIISVLLASGCLQASEVNSLAEINKPYSIKVDNNYIYVSESFEIKVFSRVTKKLIRTLGRKGEGPREFSSVPAIQLFKERISVFSLKKISLYKNDGSMIEEKKIPHGINQVRIVNDDKYIGYKRKVETDDFYLTFNLYDNAFNLLKEIYRGKWMMHKDGKFDLFETVFFEVCDGKIIYAHFDGFAVDILNASGESICNIRGNEKAIPFTGNDKKNLIEFWKTHPDYRENYKFWIERTIFPEKYPAISVCKIADDRIYIFTYLQNENKNECFIYDLKGNLIKRIFLPLQFESPKNSYPFDIHGNTLFQLVENPDGEVWQLVTTKF